MPLNVIFNLLEDCDENKSYSTLIYNYFLTSNVTLTYYITKKKICFVKYCWIHSKKYEEFEEQNHPCIKERKEGPTR